RGGEGDDTYYVNSIGDKVEEIQPNYNNPASGGIDLVISSVSFNLDSYQLWVVENLTLTGTTAINGTGNFLDNTIIGNSGKNILHGGDGNDTLSGGDGNDILYGGNGDDILTGGEGSDRISFHHPARGIDTITDFSVIADTIEVSATGFGGNLVAGAAIKVSQFILGT
ncbi:MAG TPA: furin, partial [Cyanobacteria bacterium UBA11367]|nr:furin [Cyanobacteria bacterium UBA11367]